MMQSVSVPAALVSPTQARASDRPRELPDKVAKSAQLRRQGDSAMTVDTSLSGPGPQPLVRPGDF
jgi:hypothetical protein